MKVYPCSLTATSIPDLTAAVYEIKEQAVTPFTFTYAYNSVAFCGEIKYVLNGGNTPYLNFENENKLILHSSDESELTASPFSLKVKAYPNLFQTNIAEAYFQVILNQVLTLVPSTSSGTSDFIVGG